MCQIVVRNILLRGEFPFSLYRKSTGQAILKSESGLVNMTLGERELDALNS